WRGRRLFSNRSFSISKMSYPLTESAIPQLLHWKNHSRKIAFKKYVFFFPLFTGPGILTRTLLNAGVRVVALESHSVFLPNLQSLENSLDGQLKVIYGDFFRLDPLVTGPVKPPAVCSDQLFEAMGIAAVPWRADVPVKIFGILPQKKERNTLWRLLFILYEGSSIFRYGRVELNIFISEKEYKVLTAKPGESRAYQALSVLCQVGCEIQLLHMVSLLYQLTCSCYKCWLPNDHLCLVRLTPQRDLFSGGLKPVNSATFIFMVKQCLAKRKSRLTDRLKKVDKYVDFGITDVYCTSNGGELVCVQEIFTQFRRNNKVTTSLQV
uniref:rRNA adenine N(6)-methyltransferase n=1 Tax=Anser cygnoides TaxID=8845 RepID=A0A8B9EF04_ANSCY